MKQEYYFHRVVVQVYTVLYTQSCRQRERDINQSDFFKSISGRFEGEKKGNRAKKRERKRERNNEK